jgi:transposase
MARYKHTDVEDGQGLFLTVYLKKQLLPGTFEYMLNDLLDRKIDLSLFDQSYINDITGAKAIAPSVLLKLIMYGYSKGIISSRRLGELSRNNIIAKALTEGYEPHWTKIASFISSNGKLFEQVFVKVLAYCTEMGLVGGETFAIDGLRLPSNASMELSGTEEELRKKVGVYRRMALKHVAKHRKADKEEEGKKGTDERYEERQRQIQRQIEKVERFLESLEEPRIGKQQQELKTNVTDRESAVIRSS